MPLPPTPNLALSRPAPGDPADVSGDLETLTDELDERVAPRDSHTFPGPLATEDTLTADGLFTAAAGAVAPARIRTVSAGTYTLVADDASRYLRFTNTTGCVVTINAGVLPAGTGVNFVFLGTSGELAFVAGSNVSVNGEDGRTTVTKRWRGGTLFYDNLSGSTEQWIVFGGDMAP